MSIHAPSPVVSNAQYVSRGVAARAEAERQDVRAANDNRAVEQRPAIGRGDELVRYDAFRKDADGALVSNGRVHGHSVDSAEAYAIVKHANTQTDLKISRWSEISGYFRWAAIGLMGSAFAKIGAVAITESGLGLGAMAAAVTTGAFPVLMACAIAVGGASLLMTQHVRKLQADRWMDVQGFMQERTATKIGQQVAQALGKEPAPERAAETTRWRDTVAADAALNQDAQPTR